jgi:hypothetical protein
MRRRNAAGEARRQNLTQSQPVSRALRGAACGSSFGSISPASSTTLEAPRVSCDGHGIALEEIDINVWTVAILQRPVVARFSAHIRLMFREGPVNSSSGPNQRVARRR